MLSRDVIKSFTSVQLVPSHVSVHLPLYQPPKATVAFVVPPPTVGPLVIKLFTSVQVVPSKVSVSPTRVGVCPPNAKPASLTPEAPLHRALLRLDVPAA